MLWLVVESLCTIVSKSEIKTCQASDAGSDCKSLIYVSLVLQNGKSATEALSFNLTKLTDQSGQEIRLDQPLSMSLQKSAVEVSYNLLYLQEMNFFPQEQVIDSSYMSCSEGLFLGSLKLQDSTCSLRRDASGNVIPASQGYCCACPLLTYGLALRSGGPNRGNCGFLSNSMSAHCLFFPNYWFSLYEVPSPH